MKRGEVWTLRDDKYASKARPVVILQSNDVNQFDSVIICLFTTYDSSAITTRVFIPADTENGLMKDSYVMTEKIVTVDKRELGGRIGFLHSEKLDEISKQLMIVLDIKP